MTSTLDRTETDVDEKPVPAHPALRMALARALNLDQHELTTRYDVTEMRKHLPYGEALPPCGLSFTLNDCLIMEGLFTGLLRNIGPFTPGQLLKRLFLEEVTRAGAFPQRVTYVCVSHGGPHNLFIDVTYVMMDPPPPRP